MSSESWRSLHRQLGRQLIRIALHERVVVLTAKRCHHTPHGTPMSMPTRRVHNRAPRHTSRVATTVLTSTFAQQASRELCFNGCFYGCLCTCGHGTRKDHGRGSLHGVRDRALGSESSPGSRAPWYKAGHIAHDACASEKIGQNQAPNQEYLGHVSSVEVVEVLEVEELGHDKVGDGGRDLKTGI